MRPPVAITALVACLLLSSRGTTGATGIVVVDPAGAPIPAATLVCTDPVSADVVAAPEGRGTLPAACRKARCDAEGFLPGSVEVAEGASCVMQRGLVVEGELKASPSSELTARLVPAAAGAPASTLAIKTSSVAGAATRFRFPAVKPGRHRLEVSRRDGWTCRAELGVMAAGRRAFNSGWREPAPVAVRVLDGAGKPVAGVPVAWWSGRPSETDYGAAPRSGAWTCGPATAFQTTTDGSGRARLAVDAGADVLVAAGGWKDPRGLALASFDRVPTSETALRLTPPMTVRARVVDEKDRPVACRADLDKVDADGAWLAAALPGGSLKATCGTDAVLKLGPFVPQAGVLALVPTRGLPLRASFDASAAGSVDLGTLHVVTGASARVLVRDDGGRPIVGAKVQARGSAGIVLTVEGTTDASGAADLTGLPRGALLTLEVSAAGFASAEVAARPIDESPFTVTLAKGAVVKGRVVDASGAPIEKALVFVMNRRATPAPRATSGADGAFELPGLADDAYKLFAQAAGFRDLDPVSLIIEDAEGRSDLELRLESPAPLRGRVVGPDGAPVAGAVVSLAAPSALERFDDSAAVSRAITDDGGSFEIAGSTREGMWIVATRDGFGPGVEPAPAPGSTDTAVVTLTPEARMRVRIAPSLVPLGRLNVRDGSRVGWAIRIGGRTAIEVGGLAPGEGSASVEGVRRETTLAVGQTAEVALDDGPVLEGVVTSEGRVAPRVLVAAQVESEQRFESDARDFTDEKGAYRLAALREGPHRVVAIGEDGRAERTTLLPASGTTRLDLELRSIAVAVTVVDGATQAPVEQAYVKLAPTGARCASLSSTGSWGDPGQLGFDLQVGSSGCVSDATGADGVARVAAAATGGYELSVNANQFEPYQESIALGEGLTTRKVALTKKGNAQGGVVHVDIATTPPGVSGSFTCIQAGSTSSTIPVSNRFDCPMKSGTGEVFFHADGYGAARTRFEVPDGGEITVPLVVPRGGKLVIPVSEPGSVSPVVVDATGYTWSGSYPSIAIEGRVVEVPGVGRAWVFSDLPPGAYTATVEGAARKPVVLESGGTAVAY